MSFVKEWARHEASPVARLLKPKTWLKPKVGDDVLEEDLHELAPFFRAESLPKAGKTVLFTSFVDVPYCVKFEALLSRLLALRGWSTLCVPDAFSSRFSVPYHHRLLGNRVARITDHIAWKDYPRLAAEANRVMAAGRDAVAAHAYNGSLVGLSALSSASGLDGSGKANLEDPRYARLVRTMLIRSCLYTDACARIIARHRPDLVITVEKGGVGMSEFFFQALRHGVDFVQWSGCHQPEAIMLKRYRQDNLRDHPFSISRKTWSDMLARPWDESFRKGVLLEFEEGYAGNKWFQYKKLTDHTRLAGKAEIVEKFQLDPGKKIAVIFSHILNDANLFYGKDLFVGGFREWLVETARVAARNDKVNWLLKLHPANTYRRANMGYTGEFGELIAIRETLGEIPANLRIIRPDDPFNPLSWFKSLDYAITVRGTVGAEIPCFGKRVLTAGTGRYSGLGFTEDSATAEEYLGKIAAIESLPELPEEQVRLAIRHAYLFFLVRPTSYRSFMSDRFRFPQGHPFNRDMSFKAGNFRDLASDPELSAIVDWLSASKDEDYLAWKRGTGA